MRIRITDMLTGRVKSETPITRDELAILAQGLAGGCWTEQQAILSQGIQKILMDGSTYSHSYGPSAHRVENFELIQDEQETRA